MKQYKFTALLAGLFLILSLAAFTGCGGASEEAATEETTEATTQTEAAKPPGDISEISLKDFQAKDFSGEVYNAEDVLMSSVTILHMWKTTSGDCTVTMPEVAMIAGQLPDQAEVVTYCIDGDKNTDTAEGRLASAGFNGLSLYGGTGDLAAAESMVTAVPTTLFLGTDGKQLCEPIIGAQEDMGQVFRERINQSLNEAGAGLIGP